MKFKQKFILTTESTEPSEKNSVLSVFSVVKIALSTLLRGYILCLFCLILFSCALPPEKHLESFTSNKEMLIVSLTRQGLDLAGFGRYQDAELKFRQALYLDKEADPIKLNLGVSLIKEGLFDEGLSILSELRKKDPSAFTYGVALAHGYVAAGKYDEGKALYKSLIETFDIKDDSAKLSGIHRSLASLEFLLGNEAQAFCHSEDAYNLTPIPLELDRHAKMLLALGRYQRVIELASGTTGLPKNPSADLIFTTTLSRFAINDSDGFVNILTKLKEEKVVLDGEAKKSLKRVEILTHFAPDSEDSQDFHINYSEAIYLPFAVLALNQNSLGESNG